MQELKSHVAKDLRKGIIARIQKNHTNLPWNQWWMCQKKYTKLWEPLIKHVCLSHKDHEMFPWGSKTWTRYEGQISDYKATLGGGGYYLISWLWWWHHRCLHISKLITLYTLNMWSSLYSNYTFNKAVKNKVRGKKLGSGGSSKQMTSAFKCPIEEGTWRV